jgi:hypothetical protein
MNTTYRYAPRATLRQQSYTLIQVAYAPPLEAK